MAGQCIDNDALTAIFGDPLTTINYIDMSIYQYHGVRFLGGY